MRLHFSLSLAFLKNFYFLAVQALTNYGPKCKTGFFARNVQVRAWVEGQLTDNR